jgi:type II secretory pathway predicted ATPase ExeA
MFSQYFGFREDPFGTSPDSRYLYPSQTHREAVASLEYGFLNNRGFTAMIAPPGMGKTTLLFRFLEKFRESARTAFVFDIDSQCEPREFVGHILRDIGITPALSSYEMHEQLTEALIRENRAGRRFVIVIDEAQNLSDAVLERVRLLTNFEASRGKLMHIVLSGQLQLADKLMQASLVQLRQRISTVCRLEPLSAEETVAYVDYRLKQAGYEGKPLFAKYALAMIAEASHGIPRNINNLCFNALSLCCALKSKQVDDSMVSEVIGDLHLITKLKEPIAPVSDVAAERPGERKQQKQTKRLLRIWIPAAAVVLVLCALGVAWLTGSRVPWARASTDDRASDLKAPLASVPAPAATDTGETRATETAPNSAPFAITVEPDQTLQDISEQYLGGFDIDRLHQIQALNPKLTDPDHIEVGQKIWLPGPPPVRMATNATPPASARKLP